MSIKKLLNEFLSFQLPNYSPQMNGILIAIVFGLITYYVLYKTVEDTHEILVDMAVDNPLSGPWTRAFVWLSKKTGDRLGRVTTGATFQFGLVVTFGLVAFHGYYKFLRPDIACTSPMCLMNTTLTVTSLSAFIGGFTGRTCAHIRNVARESRDRIDKDKVMDFGGWKYGLGIAGLIVVVVYLLLLPSIISQYGLDDWWWITGMYFLTVSALIPLGGIALHRCFASLRNGWEKLRPWLEDVIGKLWSDVRQRLK